MASTFTLFQGDSVVLQIPIYSSGTTPATLIAPTGAYAIAQSNTSGVTLISKTGVLTQSGGLWTMAVTLTSADTASLPPGTLYQQATVLDTDGSAETVLAAPIVVNAALSLTAISGAASTASTAALVALLTTGGANSPLALAQANLPAYLTSALVAKGSAALAGVLGTIYPAAKWKAALQNVLNGVSSATILGIGDSTMFGVGYGTPPGASTAPNTIGARDWTYIAKLATWLAALGVPTSTDSFIGSGVSNYSASDLTAYDGQLAIDSSWTLGGTGSLGGNTYRKASTAAGPITFTPYNKSTHLDLVVINNSGSWTVKCDGTTVLSYTTTASPDAPIKLTTPVQSEGYHVWTIEANSGAVSNMIGAVARNAVTPRVDILNSGFRGTTIVQTGNAAPYQALAVIGVLKPDLSLFGLGINDCRNGGNNTSVSDLSTYTNAIISTCGQYGDVMLVSPHNIAPSVEAGTGASMTNLFALYNSVAAALSLNQVKIASIVGPYNLGAAKGLYLDSLHLQDRNTADAIGAQLAHVAVAATNV